jgi:hypothetical protein
VDTIERLPPAAREALQASLLEYLRVKETLITSSTRVLGNFVCDRFTEEMAIGLRALFEGLSDGGEKAKECFVDAKQSFYRMGCAGAIELAGDYFKAISENPSVPGEIDSPITDVMRVLFPERSDDAVARYESAREEYTSVIEKKCAVEEHLDRLVKAVDHLFEFENIWGGFSIADVLERRAGRGVRVRRVLSLLFAAFSLLVVLWSLVGRSGFLSKLFGA